MLARLGINQGYLVSGHLLTYSVLFGGSLYYSYIVSPLVFKKLPREEFSNLQNQVFPTYFIGQSIGPVLLALISPYKFCPFTSGLLALSTVGGLLNYFWLLPVCRDIKEKRNKLVADKLDKTATGELTEEFKELSSQFGKYHGISTLVNTISIVALGVYGWTISRKIKL
ncbi:uncharacterized protein RJT21DRAFT_119375 [Scheffersomyces amazonensis]|uniref:uncharacterized protein n=1 Tax=Scheffersomyces amazonensis TaxID=1078765 RepID=UPI00315C4EBD